MKRLLLLLPALALLAFIAPQQRMFGDEYFGKRIDRKGAIAASELSQRMQGRDSLRIKLQGPIVAVCQKKGCWMTMNAGGADPMMVRFEDYAFFVPKDASGRTAVLEGIARYEVLTEAQRRHYAQDAGKSSDEVNAIQGDSKRLTFEAVGVILTSK